MIAPVRCVRGARSELGHALFGGMAALSTLSPGVSPSGSRNIGLDLLRAWAIFLTVLMHYVWVAGSSLLGRDIERDSLADAAGVGHFIAVWLFHSQHGVYLFFVISGYLISQGLRRKPQTHPIRFLRNRALRLLPCLWVALLACALLALAGGRELPSASGVALNFLTLNWLFPAQVPPLLTVTWSLFWEWVFYLSAAILLVATQARSRMVRVICVLVVVAGLGSLVWVLGGRSWTYLLLFATGVSVALSSAIRDALARIPGAVFVIYYAAVVLAYAWFAPAHHVTQVERFPGLATPHDFYAALFCVAAAWLIARLASADFAGGRARASLRAAQWLGERSYSLYLWHMPVIFLFSDVIGHAARLSAHRALGLAVTLVVVLGITLLLSELSYRALERPYLNRRHER